MKKIYLSFLLLLTFSGFLIAQRPDYKVVFDMSTRDTVSQQALIRELTLISRENPAAKLEVVIYGQAINMVTKTQSKQAEVIKGLIATNNISFKVCSFTMKRNSVTAADLLPAVGIVEDGIYEIIRKQHEGWGYIKVAH